MKRVLIIIASILFVLHTTAQEENISLVIKTDGGEHTMLFNELRRITFSGTTVQIQKHDGTAINEDMADIIYLSAIKTTDIATPQMNGNLVGSISSDAITVNCSAGTSVEIYNVSGSHITTRLLDADNETISIATLPKGIYLLRADGRTAKFLKR